MALEKVAQLTLGEAQERLMNELEKEISVEASRKVRESEESVQAESKELAYRSHTIKSKRSCYKQMGKRAKRPRLYLGSRRP